MANSSPTVSFKWSDELKERMAHYMCQHFTEFKTWKKMVFLRMMRDHLSIPCSEKQLKNGFETFMRKYTDIKEKFNCSLSTIPIEHNKLDKAWVLRQCPYFDILDKVMGTHPKVVQPCNISSTEHTPITAESYRENIQIKASSSKFPVLDYMPDVGTTTTTSDESFLNNVGISIHSTIHLDTDESKEIGEVIIPDFVKSEASEISVISRPFVYEDGRKRLLQTYNTENLKATFARLGMKRSHDLAASRNNLSTFATAMAERVAVHEDTEDKKLKLENEKFEYIKQLEKQKLELELAKWELEVQKFEFEKQLQLQQLADQKEEREFQLMKIEKQREFELRKLELTMELEKIRASKYT